MILEAALFIPILVLLLVGMVQIGKITYLYYTLKKIVYSAARQISVQQGVNFCDIANDANAIAAINFAITDSTGARDHSESDAGHAGDHDGMRPLREIRPPPRSRAMSAPVRPSDSGPTTWS